MYYSDKLNINRLTYLKSTIDVREYFDDRISFLLIRLFKNKLDFYAKCLSVENISMNLFNQRKLDATIFNYVFLSLERKTKIYFLLFKWISTNTHECRMYSYAHLVSIIISNKISELSYCTINDKWEYR
jgi:hypothetical protein